MKEEIKDKIHTNTRKFIRCNCRCWELYDYDFNGKYSRLLCNKHRQFFNELSPEVQALLGDQDVSIDNRKQSNIFEESIIKWVEEKPKKMSEEELIR